MRRREFISLIAGATAWPLAARAEQLAIPVVGILAEVPLVEHVTAAFRKGLAEAGYVEGKNIAFENRFANYKPEQLPEAANDLIRRNVNVIFASTPEAVAAATKATTTMPIVALDLESDPIAKAYVKSLARPGGNLTGMFLDLPELSGKQVGLLKEIVPGLSRVAIVGIPDLNVAQFEATEMAVLTAVVEPEILEVRKPDDFEPALTVAKTRHAQAGILLSSPLVFVASQRIGEIGITKRLPLISLFSEFPRNGGLISYGPNVSEIFRRSGEYVAKILHGAKPSDLPIQRPERFDLVINLKTAAALGISVPPFLLATADEVIE